MEKKYVVFKDEIESLSEMGSISPHPIDETGIVVKVDPTASQYLLSGVLEYIPTHHYSGQWAIKISFSEDNLSVDWGNYAGTNSGGFTLNVQLNAERTLLRIYITSTGGWIPYITCPIILSDEPFVPAYSASHALYKKTFI